MTCPQPIADVLARMLAHGLLRARSFGWEGRADLCAVEADHLHNLPTLLVDFAPARLAYYWEVERPLYLERMPAEDRGAWEGFWEALLPLVESREPASSRPTLAFPD